MERVHACCPSHACCSSHAISPVANRISVRLLWALADFSDCSSRFPVCVSFLSHSDLCSSSEMTSLPHGCIISFCTQTETSCRMPCPGDCVMSDWSTWGICHRVCTHQHEGGYRTQLSRFIFGTLYRLMSYQEAFICSVCTLPIGGFRVSGGSFQLCFAVQSTIIQSYFDDLTFALARITNHCA